MSVLKPVVRKMTPDGVDIYEFNATAAKNTGYSHLCEWSVAIDADGIEIDSNMEYALEFTTEQWRAFVAEVEQKLQEKK